MRAPYGKSLLPRPNALEVQKRTRRKFWSAQTPWRGATKAYADLDDGGILPLDLQYVSHAPCRRFIDEGWREPAVCDDG